jgi:acyl-CoA thioesterase-2
MIVAQALSAAMQTSERPVHSLHGYFLRPQRANEPVELTVERVRDGRTFSTRRVVTTQDSKDVFHCTCSFHGGDDGDEYQMPMPAGVPNPDGLVNEDWGPPPFEIRDAGSVRAEDGTYISTRRVWERSGEVGDDPTSHLLVAAFLSDMTGRSFRPISGEESDDYADASIDHAMWFHGPIRTDDWLLFDVQTLINALGRATVHAKMFDRDGRLVLSMAQELLIRPV